MIVELKHKQDGKQNIDNIYTLCYKIKNKKEVDKPNVRDKKIRDMSFKEIANLYGYKPQKYKDFCKTSEAEEYALTEEDVKFYKKSKKEY